MRWLKSWSRLTTSRILSRKRSSKMFQWNLQMCNKIWTMKLFSSYPQSNRSKSQLSCRLLTLDPSRMWKQSLLAHSPQTGAMCLTRDTVQRWCRHSLISLRSLKMDSKTQRSLRECPKQRHITSIYPSWSININRKETAWRARLQWQLHSPLSSITSRKTTHSIGVRPLFDMQVVSIRLVTPTWASSQRSSQEVRSIISRTTSGGFKVSRSKQLTRSNVLTITWSTRRHQPWTMWPGQPKPTKIGKSYIETWPPSR